MHTRPCTYARCAVCLARWSMRHPQLMCMQVALDEPMLPSHTSQEVVDISLTWCAAMCGVCTLCVQAVSGVAALLAEKMRGMHIARRPGIPEGQVGVYLPCPTNLPPKHQPTVLRAQLAAIRGCTIDPWLVRPLQLYNYTMTPALVQELAGLPEWNTILHFKDCTWYEAATDAYMSVAKHVPGSYARWAVDPDVPALCVMTLCVGVAKHRVPGEQPLGLYWESNAVTSKQYGGHVAFLGPYHGW